jgi:hypothetical protein
VEDEVAMLLKAKVSVKVKLLNVKINEKKECELNTSSHCSAYTDAAYTSATTTSNYNHSAARIATCYVSECCGSHSCSGGYCSCTSGTTAT